MATSFSRNPTPHMPLFEVAILQKPTPKEVEEGKGEELIMAPFAVVAADPQSAAIKATRNQSRLDNVDYNRIQLLVRPFA